MKNVLVVLIIALLFVACGEGPTPEDEMAISQITITGIPKMIPVHNGGGAEAPTFKVYINASNSMSEYDPPAAKGQTKDLIEAGDTYTVTIQLQNPNPFNGMDPNTDTGNWSGTAMYFSVFISPQDVSEHGADAIWARGGITLNKDKSTVAWGSLMNLRIPLPIVDGAAKTQAIYELIIEVDPDITKPAN